MKGTRCFIGCYGGSSTGKNVYTTFTDLGWTNFTNATTSAADGTLLTTLNTYAQANGLALWKQTVGTDATPVLCEVDRSVPNDLDGDGELASDDAVYLLYHTLLADEYPVAWDCDFNKDTVVDEDDAIYLLFHCLLPDLYPID